MNRVISLTILIFASTLLFGQRGEKTFTAMFYNVENLFDTINDPNTKDDEFTPGSEKEWNYERYQKKLKDITRVILSLPEKEAPALIGLAEVENKTVLEDLVAQRGLAREKYEIIHLDGTDPRGIDCALLYRPELFKYENHSVIPVRDLSGGDYILREILHVQGKGPDGERLHVYVNHWKSRWGGVKETEQYRIYAGIALRRELDRLLGSDSNPRYIIMGDFNDEPTNRSVYEIAKAGNKRKNPWINESFNLHYDMHNLDQGGTLNYRGDWQTYDQIIVSYSLLNQQRGLSTTFDAGKVLREEWMTYHDERNDLKVPNRTYGGPNYYGGISDHFPVYAVFKY